MNITTIKFLALTGLIMISGGQQAVAMNPTRTEVSIEELEMIMHSDFINLGGGFSDELVKNLQLRASWLIEHANEVCNLNDLGIRATEKSFVRYVTNAFTALQGNPTRQCIIIADLLCNLCNLTKKPCSEDFINCFDNQDLKRIIISLLQDGFTPTSPDTTQTNLKIKIRREEILFQDGSVLLQDFITTLSGENAENTRQEADKIIEEPEMLKAIFTPPTHFVQPDQVAQATATEDAIAK